MAALGGCAAISRGALYYPSPRPLSSCGDARELGAEIVDPGPRIPAMERARYLWAPAKDARAVAIFYHGNATSACGRASRLIKPMNALGVSLALAEYPGYAADGERPSEALILENALAVEQAVRGRSGTLPLILYGESLGSGVATWVASRRPPAALALQSPYTSIQAVASRSFFGPSSLIWTETFPAEAWAKGVDCPVLAFIAGDDQVVPPEISEAQLKNFRQVARVERIAGAGHDEMVPKHGEAYFAAMKAFLDQVAR